ncbi:DUF4832 domain-containing protein [Herbaspirillum sp. HC18]|nr:DUF4832 domain-containing protein [Herbaspirillum sp. HC18]
MLSKPLSGLSTIRVLPLLFAWLACAAADRSSLSAADGSLSSPEPAAANDAPVAKVAYRPGSGAIANPERGLYYMADCDNAIDPDKLQAWRTAEGHTLVVCSVNLGAFVEARIDAETLALFERNMATLRAAGMKAILRFSYSADTSGSDASLMWISTHLEQLKPYLEQNKDVIAVVQAGFIGGWGEWAYSRHFGNLGSLNERNWQDRKAVVEKLLQAVPPERMVQLRTPDSKRRIAGARPLDFPEAFSRSPRARLAHHNDCFLASGNDWGTYTNRSAEYPYLEAETRFVAMGGETCNYAPERSNCTNALSELSRFHYSYLNASYHADVLQALKAQGCFDEIKEKLGYRFVLESGTYPVRAKPGGGLPLTIVLRNQGWAAPFNSRDVELVLRHRSSHAVQRIRLNADPRLWLPGQALKIRQTAMLPSRLPEGPYDLLLNLPDPAPSLRDRPAYAIRLANDGTWEAETGFNRLGHVLDVKR